MNTFELGIRGRYRYFTGPSIWHECSPRQAVSLMRWRKQANDNPATQFAVLRLLYGLKNAHLQYLFDARFLARKGFNEEQILTAQELGQSLIDEIRWAGETNPDERFIVKRFRLLDFQYGRIGVLLRRLASPRYYYSPADGLSDLSFDEFVAADRAYQQNDLIGLATVLYRPRVRGKREPFHAETIAVRTKCFALLDPALLELIAFQFYGCMSYLQHCFPHVFPKRLESESEQKGRKKAGTWLDVAINMVKLDATKVALIEQLNIYLALKVLNEQLRQAEEMEKQLENLKTR